MKRYCFTLLLLLVLLNIFSQDKPSFIGINAGTSIPVGKFHGNELPDGGFAQTGFNASLEGAWFFRTWLGVGASAGTSIQPVDVGSLGYEKMKENPFLNALIIRSDPYLTFSLYTGLYFNVPLAGKFSFTAKAAGGILYAQTPYQLYKAEYELIGKNWYEISSAGDFEGSFVAGAGVSYDLNNYMALALNSEFTFNECDFNFSSPDGTVRTDQQVIAFINLNLGVILKLNPLQQ